MGRHYLLQVDCKMQLNTAQKCVKPVRSAKIRIIRPLFNVGLTNFTRISTPTWSTFIMDTNSDRHLWKFCFGVELQWCGILPAQPIGEFLVRVNRQWQINVQFQRGYLVLETKEKCFKWHVLNRSRQQLRLYHCLSHTAQLSIDLLTLASTWAFLSVKTRF